ncbi:VOC family protein, partial [Coraliomargarita sp. SDUM461004]
RYAKKILTIISTMIILAFCSDERSNNTNSNNPSESNNMPDKEATAITPFLMFTGKAEEAMDLYVTLFPNAEIKEITRWSEGEQGDVGSIKTATFSLNGQKVMCTDSPPVHDFTFTPSISLYVTCASESDFDKYCEALSKDGKFLMPPDNYGFSSKFTWVQDRYGVSWQLNLP